MTRKIIVGIVSVLIVIGVVGGIKALQVKKLIDSSKTMTVPPESVSITEVRQEKWQDTLTAIGSVTAVQGVTVTTEIPGQVHEITFESGAVVKQGDLVVKLDTSSEEAQLRAIEAQWDLARINLDRQRKLRKDTLISEAELDAAEAMMKQMQGNADTIRTTIAKKTIRAPFGGQLGIRQVNLGQYLEAGKPIASLQSLTPVYGNFSLPQQELAKLKVGMRVHMLMDAYPGKVFEGTLNAINSELDVATRSISLQATFDNPDQMLRPGMFARMEVLLPAEQDVLVIPSTAVLSAPFGDSVYIVEPGVSTNSTPAGLVLRQQFIRSGRTRGDFLAVESGLKVGERIVSSGVFKLRNKMPVVENNSVVPKSSESPRPSDT